MAVNLCNFALLFPEKRKTNSFAAGVIPASPLRASLKFQNVDFNYGSRKEVPVLQDLSLDIPEGSFTAFVGPRRVEDPGIFLIFRVFLFSV